MRLERPAGRDKREIINNFSSDDAQSNAERILNRPAPGRVTLQKSPMTHRVLKSHEQKAKKTAFSGHDSSS